jgi:hypothetical protein
VRRLRNPSCSPTIVTAVAPGRTPDLEAVLAALPRDEASPLASVAGTHFARLVVARAIEHADGTTSDELFFMVEADGTLDGWLSALVEGLGPRALEIWGHCTGCPEEGGEALVAWLRDHNHKPGFGLSAIAGVRVPMVRAALERRERIATFALESQTLDPVALKAAWERECKGR